jgi:hypothetical protein
MFNNVGSNFITAVGKLRGLACHTDPVHVPATGSDISSSIRQRLSTSCKVMLRSSGISRSRHSQSTEENTGLIHNLTSDVQNQ